MRLNYFNFKELNNRMLLTNDFGKYVFLQKEDFRKLISKKIDVESQAGRELQRAGMIYTGTGLRFSEENENILRDSKSHLATATSLHIFVVTTACNMNCIYCQANNGSTTPNCFMDNDIAEKAVDIALESPEKNLSFEFQGGEPLLNFPVIKHIVEYTELRNDGHLIEYSIVTNLSLLTEEIIDFFIENHFNISTSLDGCPSVHNKNRPFKSGEASFDIVKERIRTIKEAGLSIGAIETTTKYSLLYAADIVKTYRDLGLNSLFVRHLTQLGKANKVWNEIGYSAAEFIDFYRNVFEEIIKVNKNGFCMREQHAAILLKRIKSGRMNYMELRSPCGGGIGQLAYFADGRVFSCDEGRMLAEMGNDAFLLGNVFENSYSEIIKSSSCRAVCASSMLETIPSCCDCVYQPYCGTCPVVSYANTGDIIEKQPRSFRCQVYAGILDYLFELLLEQDPEIIQIISGWSE